MVNEGESVRARPVAGLVLICLSGFLILYMPIQLYWLSFVPGNFTFIGIFLGVMILGCGLVGWFLPRYLSLLGIFVMILSVLSIIGALGGFLIGSLLGIIGGALYFSWQAKPLRSNTENKCINEK